MLPYVVLHNAASLDGRIDWISVDLELFYGLVPTWEEDATLVGSETVLGSMTGESPGKDEETSAPPPVDPDDLRPLLVIPDSRGRVRSWGFLRRLPYWRGIVIFCSEKTPKDYLEDLGANSIDFIVAGEDHVDYRVALKELKARYQVKTVRVDSGGTLNGILLRAVLVDEVSVLTCPALVGGNTPRSIFKAPDLASGEGVVPLRLMSVEKLKGDVVWSRYQVVR